MAMLDVKLGKVARACHLNTGVEDELGIPRIVKDNTIALYSIGKKLNLIHKPGLKERSTVLLSTTSENKMASFLDTMETTCDLKRDLGSMEKKCDEIGGKIVDIPTGTACSILRSKDNPGRGYRIDDIREKKLNDDQLKYYLDVTKIQKMDVLSHYWDDMSIWSDNEEAIPKFVAYYEDRHQVYPIDVDKETFEEWFKWNDLDIVDKRDARGEVIEWDKDVTFGNLNWNRTSFDSGGDYNYFVTSFFTHNEFSQTKHVDIGRDKYRNKLQDDTIASLQVRKNHVKGFLRERKAFGQEDDEDVPKARALLEKINDGLIERGVF